MQVPVDILTKRIQKRFTLFLVILTLVLALGVSGYIFIKLYFEPEHSTGIELFVDAIYWTIITITTLGSYPTGVALSSVIGKAFTIVIVLMGIILIIVAFPLALSPWFESRMKELLSAKRVPVPRSNHVIVCGYNDIGKEVITNLRTYEVEFAVIENKPARVRELISDEVPAVIGDPTRESTLEKAHFKRAIAVITVEDDRTNAFVALTASRLVPELRIVTTVQELGNRTILKRAGATQVLAPKTTVGAILASEAMGRSMGDISRPTEGIGDLSVGHYRVSQTSNSVGKSLRSIGLDTLGLIVVGIWRQGKFKVNPKGWKLEAGDILLLLGKEEQMDFARKMF